MCSTKTIYSRRTFSNGELSIGDMTRIAKIEIGSYFRVPHLASTVYMYWLGIQIQCLDARQHRCRLIQQCAHDDQPWGSHYTPTSIPRSTFFFATRKNYDYNFHFHYVVLFQAIYIPYNQWTTFPINLFIIKTLY